MSLNRQHKHALTLVALPSLFWILSAATSDYVPCVDLPSHARVLSLLRGTAHSSVPLETNPFSPYWLVYLASWPIAAFVGEYAALKLVVACATAAVPLLMAVVLHRRGKSPFGALYCWLFIAGRAYAWGLAGILFSLPLVCLQLLLVDESRRHPHSRTIPVLVAANLVVLYYSHLVGWIFGLFVTLPVFLLGQRRARILAAVSAVVGTTLALAFKLGFRFTAYSQSSAARFPTFWHWNPSAPIRLFADAVVYSNSSLARVGVLVLCSGVLLCQRERLVRPFLAGTSLSALLEYRFLALLLGFLLFCLCTANYLFLHIRINLLLSVLVPLTIAAYQPRNAQVFGTVLCAGALLIVASGYAANRRATAAFGCISSLAAATPNHGLVYGHHVSPEEPGFVTPVRWHLHELLLRGSASSGIDAAYLGAAPLRPVENVQLPPPLDFDLSLPVQLKDGTTAILASPPITNAEVFGVDTGRRTLCGPFSLNVRE